MKNILTTLLLCISLVVGAATRYVATTGSDAAAGTIDAPWATWQYGFSHIVAGDTLYIRGGTYQPTGTSAGTPFSTEYWGGVAIRNTDGTALNRIVVMNYPSEKPILDGTNITAAQGSIGSRFGIIMRNCEYWHIKGLEVTGVLQFPTELGVGGIRLMEDCNHNILEQIVSHDNGGSGITLVYDCTDNLILNCDSYNNIDPYSTPTAYNNSDGIEIAEIAVGMTNTVRGCRMWGNCDDGMDLFDNEGIVVIDSCWAFYNSKPAGPYDANGFKLGRTNNTHGTVRRVITNSIAVGNQADGFTTGGDAYCDMDMFNNTAIANKYGFMFYLTTPADCGTITVRNNIGYNNVDNFRHKYAPMVVDHNSYDSDFQTDGPGISAADFVTVDTLGLRYSRKSGGYLPDISFATLDATSDMINAGVDVGIAYDSDAPDLGYIEYVSEAPPASPLVSTTTPYNVSIRNGTGGGTVTYDGGGSITDRGICWSTSADPETTDNSISSGTGLGSFTAAITGLAANTTYHIRAFATNEVATSYGADVEFTTPVSASYRSVGGKILFIGHKVSSNVARIPVFPQILTGTTDGYVTNVGSVAVTMPTGVAAGDLILVFIGNRYGSVLAVNTGVSGNNWNIEHQTVATDNPTAAIIWKIAEASNALTLTITPNGNCNYVAYRISDFNAADPLTVTAGEITVATNFDPPANQGAYGTLKYLWMGCAYSANASATVAPTDFGDLYVNDYNGDSQSVAWREYEYGSSYDPGAFTSPGGTYIALTCIINPIE